MRGIAEGVLGIDDLFLYAPPILLIIDLKRDCPVTVMIALALMLSESCEGENRLYRP
jgi:hypothetical protein